LDFQVCALARKDGVLYPYLGNIRGHRYENTYCPNCEDKLIQRLGYTLITYKVTSENRCPKCSRPISIAGKYLRKHRDLSSVETIAG
jgi:pyruvate formate lyase activating enzyme